MEDITQRTTVEAIVRAYEQAEASILQGCQLIAGAEQRINDALQVGEQHTGVYFLTHHRNLGSYSEPSDGLKELRRQVWRHLVDRLEVRRMMSVAKAKQLDEWLSDRQKVEPITYETVMGLMRYYIENLPEMLTEAITEVYEFLRPTHTKLKTNTQYELRSRVIMEHWVEAGWGAAAYRPRSWARPRMVALENVFSALDGRGSVSKEWRSELEQAVEKTIEDRAETTYFRIRACKNGNLHLEFKRPDLVDKFNKMAGGKRLRAG